MDKAQCAAADRTAPFRCCPGALPTFWNAGCPGTLALQACIQQAEGHSYGKDAKPSK
jgi:hypothetical protein